MIKFWAPDESVYSSRNVFSSLARIVPTGALAAHTTSVAIFV